MSISAESSISTAPTLCSRAGSTTSEQATNGKNLTTISVYQTRIVDPGSEKGGTGPCVAHIAEQDNAVSDSDEYTAPGNLRLVGRPTRGQQISIIICSFLALFQTFGITQVYGVFQAFHTGKIGLEGAMLPDDQARQRGFVALVGTLGGAGLSYLLGMAITPALSNTYCKSWRFGYFSNVTLLVGAGTLLMFFGYMGASFSTQLWHLMITQGVTVGVGGGLMGYPLYTIAPEYFYSRRALAVGLLTAGSGLGGLVYAPVIETMTDQLGIRWTLRILAVITLVFGIVITIFSPPPRTLSSQRKFMTRELSRNPCFYVMILAGLANSTVNGMPLAFGPDIGRYLGFQPRTGALILAAVNAVGSPARIIQGFVGDKYGRQNTQIGTIAASVLLVWIFWLTATVDKVKGLWWAFNITFGSLIGGWSTLASPVLIDVFGNEVFFGTNAMVCVARGIGTIIGSPIGGALLGIPKPGIGVMKDEVVGMVVFTGLMLSVSLVCCIAIRLLQARQTQCVVFA